MDRWGNLNMQQKAQLLGIYASKGYTDLASIINHYNAFQDGGPTNNKSDWAKTHEVELALQQLGWDNPNNKLHSDYAAKDDEGYYPGYNLKPVTVRPSVQQQLRDYGKNNPKVYGIVEQFDPEAAKFNNQWGLGLWATLAGVKAPELVKDATVKGLETLNKVYNPTKWYGAGLTAATAAKPLVDLTSTSNYADENGKYHTGNFWNNAYNFSTDVLFAFPAFNASKQGVKAVTDAFKYNTTLGRNMTIANELRKGINNATKYGDIRVNETSFRDPTKFYRFVEEPEVNTIRELGFNVTSTDASKLGANIASNANRFRLDTLTNKARQAKNNNTISIIKRGSAHGNVSQAAAGRPWQSSVAQSDGLFRRGLLEGNLDDGVLASTTSRSVFKPTQMSDLFSGQRIGFKTNTMPIENIRYFEDLGNGIFRYNGKVIPEKREYVLGRDYNIIPTLDRAMQEATMNQQNNPIVFARSLSNEGIDNILRYNYLEGSPSFALTKYSDDNLGRLSDLYSGDEGITFLFGKNAAGNNAKYFIGDVDTPIRQDAARALNLPATKEAINNITPEQVMLGKRLLRKNINSTPINWREAFNLTRENNFGDPDYFYNEVLLDKILDYKNAVGAIVNTDKPQYIKMLEDLGIPYGYNLTDIPFNFKGFRQGGSLGKVTSLGQWQYPHQITTIPSNNITMKGVDYPVIGVSDTGDTKYMLPNMDYLFDGNYVTEYPIN